MLTGFLNFGDEFGIQSTDAQSEGFPPYLLNRGLIKQL